MVFAFDLHNMVNRKLGKPTFGPFELVQRRSDVWDCEAMDSELLGLCLIVSLNYNSNKEPDKAIRYLDLVDTVRSLIFAFRPKSRLTQAFDHIHWTYGIHFTQLDLVIYFTTVFKHFHKSDESIAIIMARLTNRYGLCRT